jgi:CheY-specific phosphatase CheX
MPVRFFGQYLLENGVVDADKLLAGIAYQEKTNLRFGEMAVQIGLLEPDDITAILNAQKGGDVKVGEAAIRLGLLSNEQVEQVLRAQQNSHVLIGEALVATGAISREVLERELAAFLREQEQFKVTSFVPEEFDPSGIGRPAVDLVVKFLLRLARVQVKIIDSRVGRLEDPLFPVFVARVGFGGDVSGELALRAHTKMCARVAQGILGDLEPEDDAEILDATCEFLNVVCGNLCASVARNGRRLDVLAPRKGPMQLPPRPDEHMLVTTLAGPQGQLELIILTRPS